MIALPSGWTSYHLGGQSQFAPGTIPKGGTHFQIDRQKTELAVFMEKPTDEEIYDYRKGHPEFDLYLDGLILFFLAKLGNQPRSDAPFNTRRLPRNLRGIPYGYEPGKRLLLDVKLICSATNTIKALRVTTLSPALSEALTKAVVKQMHAPLSRFEYDQAIEKAYAEHPTADTMVERALIVFSDQVVGEKHAAPQTVLQSEDIADAECKAGKGVARPSALEHITLNTGHMRVSPREEVSQEVIDICRDLIVRSTSPNAHIPIPACEPYFVKSVVDGSNMCATVSKLVAGTQIPVVAIGVALEAGYGVKLWEEMHSSANMPLITEADSAPKRPWVAARLEFEGIFLAFDAMHWLGDFERCLAFAFADYASQEECMTH